MTVRDWLQLLIVPFALVVIGFLFTTQQNARQEKIEDRRAEAERATQQQNAQDEALQAYLDQMSTLLLEKDLRNSEADGEVRTLARARTVTVMQRLDSDRNGNVIRFLDEAGLIGRESSIRLLAGADLRGAHLEGTNLNSAGLHGTNLSFANLREANLNHAFLRGAHLNYANLGGAKLSFANLSDALLIDADLRGALLGRTDLSGADLRSADLSYAQTFEANLEGASLEGASLEGAILDSPILSDADLSGAKGITQEQLEQQAGSLKGATMPNGSKHP